MNFCRMQVFGGKTSEARQVPAVRLQDLPRHLQPLPRLDVDPPEGRLPEPQVPDLVLQDGDLVLRTHGAASLPSASRRSLSRHISARASQAARLPANLGLVPRWSRYEPI